MNTQQRILQLMKQLPFLLVLCALLSQPIVETFSVFSDISYELADYDFDDDAEEETEDSSEEDEQIEPNTIQSMLTITDWSLHNSHFYVQRSGLLHNVEILIPPPETA